MIIDDSKIQPSEYQPEDATGHSAATSSNTLNATEHNNRRYTPTEQTQKM
jgi:hypothetical protein